MTFGNVLGEFDRKTKEVEAVIKRVEMQGGAGGQGGHGHHGHH